MKRALVVIVFCSCFFLSFSSIDAAEKANDPSKVVTNASVTTDASNGRLWNLQNADILSVINEVSLETGKNFVVDPRVSGKISLISSKPIKAEQVYNVFLSVLAILGYSAIGDGNVVKIVPNMESGEYATRLANNKFPGRGDEVVVRVIPLQNVTASQIVPVIRPMLPQWSNVSTYIPGNVIILLGRAGNLNRIIDVVHKIDRVSDNAIDVIPLHRAAASQVAAVLTNLQNAGRSQGDTPQVSIAADERTNSILLGGNLAARSRMKYLVSQLDTPQAGAQGNTQVFYLKYLQAKTFAPILGKIAENIQGKDSGDSGAAASATTSSLAPSTGSAKSSGTPENHTSIQGEPDTNALIITASPTLMEALRCVIAKLDIRPAQVLVEAVIVEINMDDLNGLGIKWGSRNADTDQNPGTSGAFPQVSFPPLGAGTLGLIPGTSIRAVLTALQNKTGVNILSTPSIVVLDNQSAKLSVGEQVPEQTGSYATTGNATTATPFNTVTNLPVELTLKVTPQINLSDSVRLKIELKNDTLQNPDNPTLTPTINTSSISNSVLVDSNDILVIGGLISNTLTESVTKVPFLGDIPVLGLAFRSTEKEYEKKNLIVFIKPIILYDEETEETITNSKYNFARNVEINQPNEMKKNDDSHLNYILPPWKNDKVLPKPFGQ